MKTFGTFLVVCAALVIAAMIATGRIKLPAGIQPTPPPRPIVTLTEFSQLQTGMTYDQVCGIIGALGTEQARSEVPGQTTIITSFAWENADGSNMNAMFTDARMTMKAQAGLR